MTDKLLAVGGGMAVALGDGVLKVRVPHAAYAATLPLPGGVRGEDVLALGTGPVSLLTKAGDFYYHDSNTWRCAGSVHDAAPPPPPKREPRTFEVEGRGEQERGQPVEAVVLLRSVGLGVAGLGEPGDLVHAPRTLAREMIAVGSARPASPKDNVLAGAAR